MTRLALRAAEDSLVPALKQALAEGGMPVEEGTLYPLLRRLEAQGLLASEWDEDYAPPRRYYRLSREGKRAFAALSAAWRTRSNCSPA